MINITPFYNPFKKVVKSTDKNIEIVTKNGKTYKKLVKSGNK